VNSLFTPSSIEGTLILLPIAAAFGWAYGFVGHVGYAKQVAYTDPERSLAATTGVLVGIGLVIFYRHIINGQLLDALQQWFEQTLNDATPWAMLFFGIPLTLLVIAAGLAGTIGGFVGAAKGIGRLLYYLPGFFMGLPVVSHWLFVKHPAEPVVAPALRRGSAIDVDKLANALTPNIIKIAKPPPTYQSENQAGRARALKQKLRADAEVAEAIERRERARAALIRAEREVEQAKRNIKGKRSFRGSRTERCSERSIAAQAGNPGCDQTGDSRIVARHPRHSDHEHGRKRRQIPAQLRHNTSTVRIISRSKTL
jgi:hypothetical protein